MSTPRYPSVEVIQRSEPPVTGRPSRWRRPVVFLAVLVSVSAAGAGYVYSRAAVYRTSASVLTVKPTAVDRPSAGADVQHVAIQDRLLLGDEMLTRLSRSLGESGGLGLDPATLRGMLSVREVPGTNLVELSARGAGPEQLQQVVNAWARTYEAFRREQIAAATRSTGAELTDEQAQLKEKIEAARAELLAFREANDIVSLERDENRSLAGLKGLNASLNKARERLTDAAARRASVDDAIARGETVVPGEQKADIARMRVSVTRLRTRLAKLRTRYTDRYLQTDPAYRDLPGELEEQEQALAAALEVANNTVREEARQAVGTARMSVNTLETQLAQQQERVQQFTERFKQFKVMEENQARLERLYADGAERLAKITLGNQEKYPPVQVVEWAPLPERPVWPDYPRDLAIALGAALGLALFVTWLLEYLVAAPRVGAATPVLGVRVSHGQADAALESPHTPERLDHRPADTSGGGASS